MLEAAHDRIEDQWVAQVEAVRIGTVVAHDRKAGDTWRRRRSQHERAMGRAKSAGLEGADLERVVMALATTNPDIVRVQVAA